MLLCTLNGLKPRLVFLSHCAQPPLLMTGPGNTGSHLQPNIIFIPIFYGCFYCSFLNSCGPNQQGSSETLDCQNFGFCKGGALEEASADALFGKVNGLQILKPTIKLFYFSELGAFSRYQAGETSQIWSGIIFPSVGISYKRLLYLLHY